jgi:hypothetical protein
MHGADGPALSDEKVIEIRQDKQGSILFATKVTESPSFGINKLYAFSEQR